ncbi:MAG: NAD(P)/FAD-dependent oxidoreductase [Hyphomicrobiales bacterium]
MTKTATPKIIIVGAGIVGAMVTHSLARAGLNPHCVDQGEPGMGVTARSSGWINWITVDPQTEPARYKACQQAFARYAHLDKALGDTLIKRRQGALRWFDEQQKTEAMISAHKAAKSPVESVQGVRLRKLAPFLAAPPPLAAFAPDDFLLDAQAVTARLLDDAKAHGAALHPNAHVSAIETQAGKVTGLAVDDTRHDADIVVIAAGTMSNALLAPFGLDEPISTSPAALIRFSVSAIDPGPILAGPGMEVHIHPPDTITMARSVRDPLQSAVDLGHETHRRLAKAMPSLKNLQLTGSSIGHRPIPKQCTPLVGPVDGVEGLFTAVAHPGVILAPQIAEQITNLIQQRLS